MSRKEIEELRKIRDDAYAEWYHEHTKLVYDEHEVNRLNAAHVRAENNVRNAVKKQRKQANA